MVYNIQELMEALMEALQVIKDECIKNSSCKSCVLSIDGECQITHDEPNVWNLNLSDWKAFIKEA